MDSRTPLLRKSPDSESIAISFVDELPIKHTARENFRAYWLGAVVCMGGFLFGYDSGIIGGVLTLASFERDFGYSASQRTRTSSLSVGLQQLGAFVGCFISWPVTGRYGRRQALMLFTFVFCIGAAFQTINTHSLPAFYISRCVSGLGLGASTVVIPMFSSEMVPKELRGQIGSFFQLFFTFGICTSYWIDYGVSFVKHDPTIQWQIPIGLQLLPATLLAIGLLTLKESTRWLTKKGRHGEAWESLVWVRGLDSEATRLEMEEIREGVEQEAKETEGFHFKELLEGDNFKRVCTGFCIMMAQQATGATAFAYFGPQFFRMLVGGGQRDLLLTGIFGAVKVVACGSFVLFLANRFGRRQILIGGAAVMAACQLTTAAVVRARPPPEDGTVTPSGVMTVALIYLFVMVYNSSWGPMPWPYISEIFPARIREPGIAIGAASQWLFNFLFSLTTPYMMERMGWGTFLLWGIFDLMIAILAYFFLKETKNLSLEAIVYQRHKNKGLAEQFRPRRVDDQIVEGHV